MNLRRSARWKYLRVASDEARLNPNRNAEAEERCGCRRPAAVRNARLLTI
jgi:hypothetical protein